MKPIISQLPLTIAVAVLGLAGASAAQQDLLTIHGAAGSNQFGYSVSCAGDLNGDGIPDLIVGSPGFGASFVQALSGKNGAVLWTSRGANGFGFCVGHFPDISGDNVPEVLVGSPFANSGWGGAYVLSGANGVILPGFSFRGTTMSTSFGSDVRLAGDLDKDGRADILVGEPGTAPPNPGVGRVHVFSGRNGALIKTIIGSVKGDYFGRVAAGVGDVNLDGYPDVLVGAPLANGGQGLARLYSGKSLGGPGAPLVLKSFAFSVAGDQLGCSVSPVGDIDRDGVADYAIGAGRLDANGVKDAGGIYVYSGKTATLLGQWTGTFTDEQLGTSLGGAGDVNRDGWPDVVVGGPGASRNGTGSGRVTVLSGRWLAKGSAWPPTLLVVDGNNTKDWFGISVSGVGDLDQDGLADVLGGASQRDTTAGTGYVKVLSGNRRSLWTDRHAVSLSAGGTQVLSIDAGAQYGSRNYWVFGSATGTSPGTPVGSVIVPLIVDPWTEVTIAAANSPVLTAFRGTLSGAGRATARINIPGKQPSAAVGLTLYHAALIYNATTYDLATQAVTLLLTR